MFTILRHMVWPSVSL